MNKNLRQKFESLDLRSLFLTILFFAIGVSLFFYFTGLTDRIRGKNEKEFTGKTIAEIMSVKAVDKITHGRSGTRIEIENYKVTYSYVVNNKKYNQIEFIPNTLKNLEMITRLLEETDDTAFTVKFDPADPQKSILIIN